MKAAIKIIFFISICTFFSGVYFFEVQKRNISNQVEEIKSEMVSTPEIEEIINFIETSERGII